MVVFDILKLAYLDLFDRYLRHKRHKALIGELQNNRVSYPPPNIIDGSEISSLLSSAAMAVTMSPMVIEPARGPPPPTFPLQPPMLNGIPAAAFDPRKGLPSQQTAFPPQSREQRQSWPVRARWIKRRRTANLSCDLCRSLKRKARDRLLFVN